MATGTLGGDNATGRGYIIADTYTTHTDDGLNNGYDAYIYAESDTVETGTRRGLMKIQVPNSPSSDDLEITRATITAFGIQDTTGALSNTATPLCVYNQVNSTGWYEGLGGGSDDVYYNGDVQTAFRIHPVPTGIHYFVGDAGSWVNVVNISSFTNVAYPKLHSTHALRIVVALGGGAGDATLDVSNFTEAAVWGCTGANTLDISEQTNVRLFCQTDTPSTIHVIFFTDATHYSRWNVGVTASVTDEWNEINIDITGAPTGTGVDGGADFSSIDDIGLYNLSDNGTYYFDMIEAYTDRDEFRHSFDADRLSWTSIPNAANQVTFPANPAQPLIHGAGCLQITTVNGGETECYIPIASFDGINNPYFAYPYYRIWIYPATSTNTIQIYLQDTGAGGAKRIWNCSFTALNRWHEFILDITAGDVADEGGTFNKLNVNRLAFRALDVVGVNTYYVDLFEQWPSDEISVEVTCASNLATAVTLKNDAGTTFLTYDVGNANTYKYIYYNFADSIVYSLDTFHLLYTAFDQNANGYSPLDYLYIDTYTNVVIGERILWDVINYTLPQGCSWQYVNEYSNVGDWDGSRNTTTSDDYGFGANGIVASANFPLAELADFTTEGSWVTWDVTPLFTIANYSWGDTVPITLIQTTDTDGYHDVNVRNSVTVIGSRNSFNIKPYVTITYKDPSPFPVPFYVYAYSNDKRLPQFKWESFSDKDILRLYFQYGVSSNFTYNNTNEITTNKGTPVTDLNGDNDESPCYATTAILATQFPENTLRYFAMYIEDNANIEQTAISTYATKTNEALAIRPTVNVHHVRSTTDLTTGANIDVQEEVFLHIASGGATLTAAPANAAFTGMAKVIVNWGDGTGTNEFKFIQDVLAAAPAYISANTIAFSNLNPDTITDSGGGFVAAGFETGMQIVVSGSASNNGTYTIANVVAGTITLVAGDELVNELAGAAVIIKALQIEVTDATKFNVGDYIVLADYDDADDVQFKSITGINVGTNVITLSSAIGAGHDFGIGDPVYVANNLRHRYVKSGTWYPTVQTENDQGFRSDIHAVTTDPAPVAITPIAVLKASPINNVTTGSYRFDFKQSYSRVANDQIDRYEYRYAANGGAWSGWTSTAAVPYVVRTATQIGIGAAGYSDIQLRVSIDTGGTYSANTAQVRVYSTAANTFNFNTDLVDGFMTLSYSFGNKTLKTEGQNINDIAYLGEGFVTLRLSNASLHTDTDRDGVFDDVDAIRNAQMNNYQVAIDLPNGAGGKTTYYGVFDNVPMNEQGRKYGQGWECSITVNVS